MSCSTAKGFLGSASATGYMTRFSELVNSGKYHCYIIKGGPGYDKSAVMRTIVSYFADREDTVEELYCSGDPESLDAIVLHSMGAIVVDSFPPHAFEGSFPGLCQSIVNLERCWDIAKLRSQKEAILQYYTESTRSQVRAKRFLGAFASLNGDTCTLAMEHLNRHKLSAFATRLCHRIAPRGKGEIGESSYMQLSAVTPEGYKTLTETLAAYDTVYVLSDPLFVAADLLLCELTACALQRGLNAIVSDSPLFSTRMQEHLLLPEIKTAFVTSNHINKLSIPGCRMINCMRFMDKTQLMRKKQRIGFNKKAGQELFDEAVLSLRHAKDASDELGRCYILATDFDRVDEETEALCKRIETGKQSSY